MGGARENKSRWPFSGLAFRRDPIRCSHHETFPSLGIGHFIWYPASFNGRFKESWPEFIVFAERNGANPPAIAKRADAPWDSRAEFQREFNSPEMAGLRKWLASTVGVQTDFIISRSRASLPKMLNAAPVSGLEPPQNGIGCQTKLPNEMLA